MKFEMNSRKGITLVALVVTIIVLIILAAVVLNILVGPNGIITRTKEGTESWKSEQEREKGLLADAEAYMNNALGGGTGGSGDDDGGGTPPPPAIEEAAPTGSGGTDVTIAGNCGVIEIAWVDKNNQVKNNPIEPELMGMEKVAWNGATEKSGGEITTNAEWYSYNTSNWANAKHNENYFVWIPRFAYKIIYFDTDAHKNAYLSNNENQDGIVGYYTKHGKINKTQNKIIIAADAGIQSPVTSGYTDYIVHPAFLGIGTENIGGGFGVDAAGIKGIWVSKYEASDNSGNVNIVPGAEPWTFLTIADCYNEAFAYDRPRESHLMKNSEWGAVRIFSS